MKHPKTIIAGTLIGLSAAIYTSKTLIVGDLQGTQKFLFNAMGVLPLNLLLMTFIFNKLLTLHTKKSQIQKRNMLMNSFFSEFGNKLLRTLADLDSSKDNLAQGTDNIECWEGEGIQSICLTFEAYKPTIQAGIGDLRKVRTLLNEEHQFMLTLLQHPAMNAHEKFSDLVWALFHLEDELNHRDGHVDLPKSDINHLGGDLERVYNHLTSQWVDYMLYLKEHYPYLFSLAVRTSPFKQSNTAVIS